MYLLSDTTDDAVEVLKERLDGLGDSLLVVGTGDLRNVHVHVDDVGAAIEAGIAAGRPHRIKVTHFRDQLTRQPDSDAQAVVSCAAGEGLAGAFRSAGAVVVPSGPRRRANAAQFLEAVRSTGAGRVILLPNDGDTLLAANAAAKVAAEEGVDLRVVRRPDRGPGHRGARGLRPRPAVRRQRPRDEQRGGRHPQRRGHRGHQGGADLRRSVPPG